MSLVSRARSAIYDAVIVGMTAGWYRAVLARLPRGCRLLDVGIGTGAALLANAALLRERDVRVTGVDVDAAYVERCRAAVAHAGLDDRVAVHLESIDTHRGGPYDAAYFSGSFMLLPAPVASLRRVGSLLAGGGVVYFTQTFEQRRSRVVELVKPLLSLVTSIDFGRVTYEPEFRATIAEAGFRLIELERLIPGARRAAVLAVARPRVS
jgi:cyclopropane fatty-acyl-phospholipid synthase-like methyltransferase